MGSFPLKDQVGCAYCPTRTNTAVNKEEFYQKENPAVERIAKRFHYPDSAVDTEDVRQKIWLDFLKDEATKPEGTNMQQHLMRIAATESIDILRTTSRRKKRYDAVTDDHIVFLGKQNNIDIEETAINNLVNDDLVKELGEIVKSKLHLELLLFSAAGYSYQEIGDLKGLSAKTVDNLLYKTRKRIKKQLKTEGR